MADRGLAGGHWWPAFCTENYNTYFIVTGWQVGLINPDWGGCSVVKVLCFHVWVPPHLISGGWQPACNSSLRSKEPCSPFVGSFPIASVPLSASSPCLTLLVLNLHFAQSILFYISAFPSCFSLTHLSPTHCGQWQHQGVTFKMCHNLPFFYWKFSSGFLSFS